MTTLRKRYDQLIQDRETISMGMNCGGEEFLKDLPCDLQEDSRLRAKEVHRKAKKLRKFNTVLLSIYGSLAAIESRIGLSKSNTNERCVNLMTKIPGSRARLVLATLFPKKVFERVFAEPISDIQVEYLDALAKGRSRHAKWIVLRGHMIILATVAFYVYSSTIGKLIRDFLKPTSMSD